MAKDLKPCPFCGGLKISKGDDVFYCLDCEATNRVENGWNTRPIEDALRVTVDLTKEQLEFEHKSSKACPSCGQMWPTHGAMCGLWVTWEEAERLKLESADWCEKWTDAGHELLAYKQRERRYVQALEKISKPALGGKQQQWIAQEALSPGSQEADHIPDAAKKVEVSEEEIAREKAIRNNLAALKKDEGREGDACKHESSWFDRSIALRKDGRMSMANICNDCGAEC